MNRDVNNPASQSITFRVREMTAVVLDKMRNEYERKNPSWAPITTTDLLNWVIWTAYEHIFENGCKQAAGRKRRSRGSRQGNHGPSSP
jgi:hypothetical protein